MGEEKWKLIKDFNSYEVSNTGKVRSKDRTITTGFGTFIKKGKELKAVDNGKGYLKVVLRQDGRIQREYIHRLVSIAFLPNPQDKPFINHLDNNPQNNNVQNLEWCTHQENIDWMHLQGRARRTPEWLKHLHESQHKTYRQVIGKNITTGEKLVFEKLDGVKEAGFQPSCVCDCCKGKRKQHKGYEWSYKE